MVAGPRVETKDPAREVAMEPGMDDCMESMSMGCACTDAMSSDAPRAAPPPGLISHDGRPAR